MIAQYLILFGYFAALFLIGIIASRRIHNLRDYFVGGKRMGYWVVAFSARATGESAWLLLGLTGLGAMVGMSAFWVVAGEVIGVGIAWFWMAHPFKRATDGFDSVTVPDFLVSKFTDGVSKRARLIRLLAAGALALFVTIYVSAQIDATGKAFESFLGWNYYAGALAGFGIVVLYTFSGGFVAVSWSDLFQGLLMLLGLISVPVFASSALAPGEGLIHSLAAIDSGLLDPFGPGGLTLRNACIIVSYSAVGLGFLGSPQIFVRFMSIKNEGEINRGRWVALAYTLLTDAGAVLTGMLGRVLLTGPDVPIEPVLGTAAENVLPLLVQHLFPAIIVGLFIAAVLSAIMSTIDSLLVVASSAVTRDLYQQMYHPDLKDEALTRLSRTVTLALAGLALGIALTVSVLSPDRTVFWFVIFGWSGIAATFCPGILLSLFWRRFNSSGLIASMIVGFACVPLFKFVFPLLPTVGPYIGLLGEMAPSIFVALIAGISVSIWSDPAQNDADTRPASVLRTSD